MPRLLVKNDQHCYVIFEMHGRAYINTLSGGVFEYEVTTEIYPGELQPLLQSREKQIALVDAITKHPAAFAARRITPALMIWNTIHVLQDLPRTSGTMDQARIRTSAEHLRKKLSEYPQFAVISDALSSVIVDACDGRIVAPLDWSGIPCGYAFSDGPCREFDDLCEAYARFRIEITGGETVARKAILATIARLPTTST